jgi:hypothetical protein
MREEMNFMSETTVYELVCLPAERRSIGCRWVLEFKTDLKGFCLQGTSYRVGVLAGTGG